ncbi:hypothetical protein Cgig2_030910 [Carnegiea gigantea]|uniref:Uncharacterized protein n=1 Tax=Carnegiea gigantea TaxID=171969 RepID=A0A9Q1KIM3_9CARY|nr:hypothetical protein Cgig2_030910 [Carnegiea gigantea]
MEAAKSVKLEIFAHEIVIKQIITMLWRLRMNKVAPCLLCEVQETCKQHTERRAGARAYTWPPSKDLNTNYASEGLYPSKAINSNVFGPRIFKQNVYFTSIPNPGILCIRFKETVVACIVTINRQELGTQQSLNGMKRNSLPITRHDALYCTTLIMSQPNLEYALKAYLLTKRVKANFFHGKSMSCPHSPPYYPNTHTCITTKESGKKIPVCKM